MIKNYLLQNWTMLLLLAAFAIALHISVFLDKKTIRRTYVLIIAVFLLSIAVFVEFSFADSIEHRPLRTALMALRYSATPPHHRPDRLYAREKATVACVIPAMILTVINLVSIPTGIVFGIGETNELIRGPLGYLPYIVSGGYCLFLICLLLRRSNK